MGPEVTRKFTGTNRKSSRVEHSLQTGGHLRKYKAKPTEMCNHVTGKYVNILRCEGFNFLLKYYAKMFFLIDLYFTF